jgi:LacI family transcriptional regulator
VAYLTLEDIAKQAGVSRSTVSRVVNDQPNVSEDVRVRVRKVIRNTGYHPNAAAQTLASQRSWMIGLVLPHSVSFFFTDPYYPNLVKGIAQACNQYKYTLAFFLVGNKDDEINIFPRVARKGQLDGVIVQSGHHGDQEIIRLLMEQNMPVVVAGRPFKTRGISFIDIDNMDAAYQVVSHLISRNYIRIATITGPHNSTVGIDRKEGYLKALTDGGHTIDKDLIVEGDFSEQGGYEAMQKLLSFHPDSVFAASDVLAMGAIRAVREAGLSIPDDIAFIGFDDLLIPTMSGVSLSTVRQPVVQIGEKAVEMLIDLIENGINPPRRMTLNTELIIRESCR